MRKRHKCGIGCNAERDERHFIDTAWREAQPSGTQTHIRERSDEERQHGPKCKHHCSRAERKDQTPPPYYTTVWWLRASGYELQEALTTLQIFGSDLTFVRSV